MAQASPRDQHRNTAPAGPEQLRGRPAEGASLAAEHRAHLNRVTGQNYGAFRVCTLVLEPQKLPIRFEQMQAR